MITNTLKITFAITATLAISACDESSFRTISPNNLVVPEPTAVQVVRPVQVNKPGTQECTPEFYDAHKEVLSEIQNVINLINAEVPVDTAVIKENAKEASELCVSLLASATGEKQCDVLLDNSTVHKELKLKEIEDGCKEIDTILTNLGAK